MNVLILGSGGREHAFSIKLLESDKINQLFVAPGNAGTHKIATNININPTDFDCTGSLEIYASLDPLVDLNCTEGCVLIGTIEPSLLPDSMGVTYTLASWQPFEDYNFLTIALKANNDNQTAIAFIDDVCVSSVPVESECCQDSIGFFQDFTYL